MVATVGDTADPVIIHASKNVQLPTEGINICSDSQFALNVLNDKESGMDF